MRELDNVISIETEVNGFDKLIYCEIVDRKTLDEFAYKPLKPILSDRYSLENDYNYYLAVKNLSERKFLAVRK